MEAGYGSFFCQSVKAKLVAMKSAVAYSSGADKHTNVLSPVGARLPL